MKIYIKPITFILKYDFWPLQGSTTHLTYLHIVLTTKVKIVVLSNRWWCNIYLGSCFSTFIIHHIITRYTVLSRECTGDFQSSYDEYTWRADSQSRAYFREQAQQTLSLILISELVEPELRNSRSADQSPLNHLWVGSAWGRHVSSESSSSSSSVECRWHDPQRTKLKAEPLLKCRF